MVTAIIAVVFSGIALVFTIVAFIIGRGKDTKESITEESLKFDGIKESLIKVNMKLDQVCATTSETRSDIKAMQNQYTEMDKRIIIIERDLKTLWNKVDGLIDK